jgi:DNA-binding MarR family transcriptional regulator
MAAPAFDLDRHVFFWITQVIGARDRELAQGLKDHGLRVPEWRCLAALYSKKHSTMSELAELATIDRTTLTRTVDRMQDAGWIERLADAADMRVTRLALTASGKKMFERIWPEVQRLNQLALAGLSASQIETLKRILGQMRENLDSYVGESHA